MKNFTLPLVNRGKSKLTVKRFFFGNAGAKNYYYAARHTAGNIYLLWIESDRFGKTHTFPCVIEEDGDPMVYLTGGGLGQKNKNAEMINRWNLMINPESFEREFDLTVLTSEEFQNEYMGYKGSAFEKAAAGEAEPEALPESALALEEPQDFEETKPE